MQFSVEFPHERHQSRYSSNFGTPDKPSEVSETLLRPNQIDGYFRLVFRGFPQRHAEEVQENGGKKLRLPLVSRTVSQNRMISTCINVQMYLLV